MLTRKTLSEYITRMLGGGKVSVELDDEDLTEVIDHTLDAMRGYYSGVRYIQVQGPGPIDLSAHNIVRIVGILKTQNNIMDRLQSYIFGAPGIIVYDSSFRESYISYLVYQMMGREFENLQNLTWKYIPPMVYISEPESCVLKCIVSTRNLTDIEPESEWYRWAKDYALALAKIIVGRKRSKYVLTNSQYQIDGDAILQEGNQEKQALEDSRIGTFFVL